MSVDVELLFRDLPLELMREEAFDVSVERYDDLFLMARHGRDPALIDNWRHRLKHKSDVEKMINHWHVYDMLVHDGIDEKVINRLGDYCFHLWSRRLREMDPAFACIKYLGYGPEISFFRLADVSTPPDHASLTIDAFCDRFSTEIIEYSGMFFWREGFRRSRVDQMLKAKEASLHIELMCNEIDVKPFFPHRSPCELNALADEIYFHLARLFHDRGLTFNIDKYFDDKQSPGLSFSQLDGAQIVTAPQTKQ